ncbi:MAG: metallophosphoesterase [Anaerolineales bacterium]
MNELISGWKFNPNKITISDLPIELTNLPLEFNDYRIVQISDFHLGSWLDEQDLGQIIDIVNQLKPDLIAITGDFVNSNPGRYSPVLLQTLSKLFAKDAIVAVLGNHDHYSEPDIIRDVLRESNIIELNNRVYPIQRSSSYLYFAGVDDHLTKKDDLQNVLNQIPDESTAILLAHEPDYADISSMSGTFDIQLSGHSHGGQICLPYFGSLYLPRYGRKYSSGIYRINGMVLYTNRGLGTSWLPFRYNCPPEIAIFTLSAPIN